MVEVNVESKISQNCQMISQFGSRLGTNFFKPEGKEIWQGGKEGFERDKAAIARDESKDFILNRSPRKYQSKSYRVRGTQIVYDEVAEELVILVNPKENGTYDLRLPITKDLIRRGVVTQENVLKALNSEDNGTTFFIDAEGLTKILNAANETEVRRLTTLRENIDKMIQNIKACIAENKQKAEQSTKEWVDSAISPDMGDVINRTATGVIVTEKSDN